MAITKIYFHFSVNDKFFAEVGKELKRSNVNVELSGVANGKRDF